MTSTSTVAWIKSPAGALFGGAVKGTPSLISHGVAKMSTDSRPKSETGRKSTMAKVSGDVSRVPRLTNMKRGGGFRSSFSGRVATVFGATGTLGRVVCNRLGKEGTQIIVPYRGDHYDARPLKVCGDLGQVLFTEYHLKDEESIRAAIKYSDVVINCIGSEWETKNFSFRDVNVEGPQRLARLSREAGVRDFVHISHINAREKPDSIWSKGSQFLKTKWEGEGAVLDEFPDATIFRPVDLVGVPDYFTHYYHSWNRRGLVKRLPVWKKGKYCIKQPLSYSDLGSAIMLALDDPFAKGKIIEAMGKHRYTLRELLDFMHAVTDKTEVSGFIRTDLRFDPVPFVKAFIVQTAGLGQKWMRGQTIERLERTQLSDVSEGLYNINDLGVFPKDIKRAIIEASAMYHYSGMMIHSDWTFIDLHPISRLEEDNLLQEEQEARSVAKLIGLLG